MIPGCCHTRLRSQVIPIGGWGLPLCLYQSRVPRYPYYGLGFPIIPIWSWDSLPLFPHQAGIPSDPYTGVVPPAIPIPAWGSWLSFYWSGVPCCLSGSPHQPDIDLRSTVIPTPEMGTGSSLYGPGRPGACIPPLTQGCAHLHPEADTRSPNPELVPRTLCAPTQTWTPGVTHRAPDNKRDPRGSVSPFSIRTPGGSNPGDSHTPSPGWRPARGPGDRKSVV